MTLLRFQLYSNSALLQNKLQAYEDAKGSADLALGLGKEAVPDGDLAKGHFRRAVASVALKDDEAALKDLEAAAKLAPGDAAIQKEMATVKRRAQEAARKEKEAMKKFFS